MNAKKLIKPEKLSPGDTIGIISPAGAVKENNLWDTAKEYFEKKGYKVKIAAHARDKKAYLAGSDEDRLSDLMSFFEDKEIKAILCSRGGYGTFRLLKDINFQTIKDNPKIFIGYSDITALLVNMLEKSNLVTFQGPLALSDFGVDYVNDFTSSNFFEILEGKVKLPYSYNNPINYECISSGEITGELIAANLSILTGLLGTPYFPDLGGKILILEDIGEPLYKIDRMLMQLKLANIFEFTAGLLFGEFTSVTASDNSENMRLKTVDTIKEITEGLYIPVGYGFPVSHGSCKATMPIGVKYYFNSKDFRLSIEEEYLI